MSKKLIMVTSITYAMKSKQILANSGIYSDIERTPKNKSTDACGYSLFVPKRSDEAMQILKAHGIKVLGTIDKEIGN